MRYLILLYIISTSISGFKMTSSEHVGSLITKSNIGDQSITFASGKLSLAVPSNLKHINEAELISEYPSVSQRPTAMFNDKVAKIKFAINYGSSNAIDADLPQIKNYFDNIYRKAAYNFISSDLVSVKHKNFILIKFELRDESSTDHKLFNYLFITSIGGKLFMADYSFPAELRLTEENKAELILKSVTIKK